MQQLMQQEQNDKIASERRSQVGTGDRSERIRTDILSGKLVVDKTYAAAKAKGIAPAGLGAIDD